MDHVTAAIIEARAAAASNKHASRIDRVVSRRADALIRLFEKKFAHNKALALAAGALAKDVKSPTLAEAFERALANSGASSDPEMLAAAEALLALLDLPIVRASGKEPAAPSALLVTGLFRDRDSVKRASDCIVSRGYTADEVFLVMSENTRQSHFGDTASVRRPDEGPVGVIGAILESLATAGDTLSLPGPGLQLGGPIAAAMAGRGVSSLARSVSDVFIPQERIEHYTDEFKNGGILIGVNLHTADDLSEIESGWIEAGGDLIFGPAGAIVPGEADTIVPPAIGVGAGSGASMGAATGAVGGPIGMAAGAAIGAIAGGMDGGGDNAATSLIEPPLEEAAPSRKVLVTGHTEAAPRSPVSNPTRVTRFASAWPHHPCLTSPRGTSMSPAFPGVAWKCAGSWRPTLSNSSPFHPTAPSNARSAYRLYPGQQFRSKSGATSRSRSSGQAVH
jgi:hypothetical protein